MDISTLSRPHRRPSVSNLGRYTVFNNQLPDKHPSHPHFPPSLHMKEANHQCDLPFFTSDPADTRITALIPAPQTLNAFPPIRRVPFPSRLTDEGSAGCQTALLVAPRAH